MRDYCYLTVYLKGKYNNTIKIYRRVMTMKKIIAGLLSAGMLLGLLSRLCASICAGNAGGSTCTDTGASAGDGICGRGQR